MADIEARKQQLKQDFTRQRGYWSDLWNGLLERDPDFFEAYKNFSSVPWLRKGLDPKVRELIYVAIDASTTHLYGPGTRIHMTNALGYGATEHEVLEVLELTSIIGVHSCTVGVPILLEELAAAGKDDVTGRPLTAEEQAIKADYIAVHGHWDAVWEGILRLSPDYFRAYAGLSGVPWKTGSLEPKVKEFIHIAVNAATTTLHKPGLRFHIRRALELGATAKEIMEIFELISVLGIHTITDSLPILEETAAAHRG